MNGPNPITYQEIESWIRLYDINIHSFEIDLIKKLDSSYLSKISENQKMKQNKKSNKRK